MKVSKELLEEARISEELAEEYSKLVKACLESMSLALEEEILNDE